LIDFLHKNAKVGKKHGLQIKNIVILQGFENID